MSLCKPEKNVSSPIQHPYLYFLSHMYFIVELYFFNVLLYIMVLIEVFIS